MLAPRKNAGKRFQLLVIVWIISIYWPNLAKLSNFLQQMIALRDTVKKNEKLLLPCQGQSELWGWSLSGYSLLHQATQEEVFGVVESTHRWTSAY